MVNFLRGDRYPACLQPLLSAWAARASTVGGFSPERIARELRAAPLANRDLLEVVTHCAKRART